VEPVDARLTHSPAELPCARCGKSMAVERLFYALDKVVSVGYKCLSCGYEETRAADVTGDIIKTD